MKRVAGIEGMHIMRHEFSRVVMILGGLKATSPRLVHADLTNFVSHELMQVAFRNCSSLGLLHFVTSTATRQ